MFVVASLMEGCVLCSLNMECHKKIENIIQFMLLNVAILAFYTWHEDNKRSNVELAFEFDKRWEEMITIIRKEIDEIEKESHDKKADIDVKKYLKKLEQTQGNLKFFLEKIKYYADKNVENSYIDIISILNKLEESATLIIDISDKNPEERNIVLKFYKENLEEIYTYIERTKIYKNSDEMKSRIDDIKNIIESCNENSTESSDDNPKSSKKLIGKSVGNVRYFKSTNESNILFTSRNWNGENSEKYGTWYTIPKTGERSLKETEDKDKGYYFIVREVDKNNEFPYLYISNKGLRELFKKKKMDTDDNYVHLYFNWYKDNYALGVTDERDAIELDKGTFELGKAKLVDGNLYKTKKFDTSSAKLVTID